MGLHNVAIDNINNISFYSAIFSARYENIKPGPELTDPGQEKGGIIMESVSGMKRD